MPPDLQKLLITGVTGLLGNTLAANAMERYEIHGVARHPEKTQLACATHAIDLLDERRVAALMEQLNPQVVVHAAAMTSVDQCEKNPEMAHAVNVMATHHLLKALRDRPCRLIFISTDSVFDGIRGNYSEEDTPAPLHVYGRTKLEAEKAVLQARSDALVIRTAFYGWNVLPQSSLAEWMLSDLRMGKKFFGFTDVFFSPLLSDHLAQAIIRLAAAPTNGILHVAGRESCSKYQFARQLAVTFGFDPSAIVPVTSETVQRVRRPKNVSLCVERAGAILGRPLPNLMEGLTAFAAEGAVPRGTAP